ncbi:hypothetical protein O6V14_18930, partial [Sphingomonas faeni]|uniref:hypothetical protein n=1 Tax=Sphingomonas faeni TaxID=185950 RepID=UPI003350F238
LIDWDKASNPFGDGHLRLVQSGSDTLLQLDRDGSGAGYSFQTLLTFDNTQASSFTAKDLGYAPGSVSTGSAMYDWTSDITHGWQENLELSHGF